MHTAVAGEKPEKSTNTVGGVLSCALEVVSTPAVAAFARILCTGVCSHPFSIPSLAQHPEREHCVALRSLAAPRDSSTDGGWDDVNGC